MQEIKPQRVASEDTTLICHAHIASHSCTKLRIVLHVSFSDFNSLRTTRTIIHKFFVLCAIYGHLVELHKDTERSSFVGLILLYMSVSVITLLKDSSKRTLLTMQRCYFNLST